MSIPFLAVINNIHRTIQTDVQIKEAKKKNLSDLFYSHQKNSIEYFATHIKHSLKVGVRQHIYEERLIKVKHSYKLYQRMFSNSSSLSNDFTVSEEYKKAILHTWGRINAILLESNFRYNFNMDKPYNTRHAKNIYSLEICLRKLAKQLHLDEMRYKHIFQIYEKGGFTLITGIQNEADLKGIIKAMWTITNDIFLIANISILKLSDHTNIRQFLNSIQSYTHLEDIFTWKTNAVAGLEESVKYKPSFKKYAS